MYGAYYIARPHGDFFDKNPLADGTHGIRLVSFRLSSQGVFIFIVFVHAWREQGYDLANCARGRTQACQSARLPHYHTAFSSVKSVYATRRGHTSPLKSLRGNVEIFRQINLILTPDFPTLLATQSVEKSAFFYLLLPVKHSINTHASVRKRQFS